MTFVYIHPDAKQDLTVMMRSGEQSSVAAILAVIEQINADEDLFDRLTQTGFGVRGVDLFNIHRWEEMWRLGENLWRMRLWSMEDFGVNRRIIYAFLPKEHSCFVVGVVPRSFDYALNHTLSQRIKRACEQLRDEYSY